MTCRAGVRRVYSTPAHLVDDGVGPGEVDTSEEAAVGEEQGQHPHTSLTQLEGHLQTKEA